MSRRKGVEQEAIREFERSKIAHEMGDGDLKRGRRGNGVQLAMSFARNDRVISLSSLLTKKS